MKKHHLTLIAAAMITTSMLPIAAQTLNDGSSEQPPTIQMRVENIRTRQDAAIAELVSVFNRVSTQPELISSKEVVDAIDQGDRALKSTKASCDSILAVLRKEAKTITDEASFSDDQKTELLGAVELLITKSEELSAKSVATAKHLSSSYKEMAKWRKIYKSYLNLDGQAKANERLKASVDEFSKGLSAAPDATEPGAVKTADGKNPE